MFARGIFGRKRSDAVLPETVGACPATVMGQSSEFEKFLARVGGHGASPSLTYSGIQGAIDGMTAEDRADLLASLADETDTLPKSVWPNGKQRENHLDLTIRRCLAAGVAPRADHLKPFLVVLTEAKLFSSIYFQDLVFQMVRAIEAAIAAGGYLIDEDCALLQAYSEKQRAAADKERQRTQKRGWRELGARIDALAGITLDAGSIVLDRCESTDHALAFEPLHRDTRFWTQLFAATAEALSALAVELKSNRLPSWAVSETAFAERFFAVGPIVPRFGDWDDPSLLLNDVDGRGFARFRAAMKGCKLADPALYATAADRYEAFAPMTTQVWCTAAIPMINRLADLEAPGGTALVEQMVDTRDGTRPPAKWLKETLAIAQREGLESAQARLLHWLEAYHTPMVTQTSVTDAWNCEVVAERAGALAAKHPDWPELIDQSQISALGAAIALDLACANRLKLVSLAFFRMEKSERRQGQLAIGSLGHRAPNNYSHHSGHVRNALTCSMENESVLRAAMWLLPYLPDKAASIVALERSALASASMKAGNRDGYRSKTTANAAVVALKTIGTPEAMLALARIGREVDYVAVQQAVRKILSE